MTQLLQNAAYGTALILALAALRRVLKDRLLPEARLALWAVCLFRLLTPAAPESVLSLWGLFSKPAPAPVRTPQPYLPAPLPNATVPQPTTPAFSWATALALVWLAVGAALALRYVLSWRRTHRAVAGAIPLGRDDPRYAPLPKCARLREGVMEGAPLTFGVVRPTVVLSPGLEGEELICVLAHEGVHAARRDNLWHYVMALALAVHWWNPAVWLMSRLLRRDIELACDRAALRRLGADKRADYARALVSLATQGSDPAFCQTFGRKAAEERILSIMKFKKTSIIGVIFSLALVLAVTAAFASEPVDAENPSTAPAVETKCDPESGNVTQYTVDLDVLKQNLDRHVAEGSMLQGVADKVWEMAQDLAQDGKALVWSFQGDSGLTLDELHRVCSRDENGNLVPVDPVDVVNYFILPTAGDPTAYVEEGEDISDMIGSLLGEADIIYDEGKTPSDYDVKLPVFDEDGNPVSNGIIGTRFSEYREEDAPNAASQIGNRFYSYKVVTDDDAVVRTSDGLYDLCKDKTCKVSYDHCHIDGKAVRVYYQNPGLLCAHDGCDNDKPHEHDGVQYAGKAPEAYTILDPDLEPAPSAVPVSSGCRQNHHGNCHH